MKKVKVPYKILYLNHAAHIGGAEIALLDLLTYLDRGKYCPVVFSPPGELAEALISLDISWHPIPIVDGLNRYTLPRFLWNLPRLRALLSQEAPALLHGNTNFSSEYTGVLSPWMRIPTVGHIRDIEPLGFMGRWTIRQNTKLVAISGAVKQYLTSEHVPESQIVQVYDGVDLKQYQPRQDGRDNMVIGIIGQLGTRKGHFSLLEAVSKLVITYTHLHLWIVGKEPAHSKERYTERLHQYVKEHHLEHWVTFWGFRKDIPKILADLDILVVPSLQEPFGKIIIEGMAMAKPVVASNAGGIPEIVVDGHTGILVPPGNSESIRQALESLITDPQTGKTMGIHGRKRVEQFFSLERNVQQTEQVYEEILLKA